MWTPRLPCLSTVDPPPPRITFASSLEAPPLDEARVDDLLHHLNTRHWGRFISFQSNLA